MTITTYVRARIDSEIKNDATRTLKTMGLTMSDFIRIAVTNVATNKALPFDIHAGHTPNATTLQAMQESSEIGKRLEEKYKGVLFDD